MTLELNTRQYWKKKNQPNNNNLGFLRNHERTEVKAENLGEKMIQEISIKPASVDSRYSLRSEKLPNRLDWLVFMIVMKILLFFKTILI